jgi:hypothetical protein
MKNLLLTAILLSLLSSCHTMVEDEFQDFKKTPVLNAFLQADSILKVQLTFTANLKDSTPDYVSNAQVVIESSLGKLDTLTYTQKGWYVSSHTALAGVTYTCKADIAGFQQVRAQTTIPDYNIILDLVFTELADLGSQGEVISSYEFSIASFKTRTCYWQVRLVTQGFDYEYNQKTKKMIQYPSWNSQEIYMQTDRDSVLLTEAEPLTVFSNKKMKNDTYKVKFFINSYSNGFEPSRRFFIELRSIDESYYNYQKKLYLYYLSEYTDLGSSPQTYPLYSNVINGLGVFTSFSVYRKCVVD